jgi:hypothetical protein
MKYTTRTTQITVLPAGEPIFSEQATTITIEDEAAGEFLVVEQHDGGKIAITPEEWGELKNAVDMMFSLIRDREEKEERNQNE